MKTAVLADMKTCFDKKALGLIVSKWVQWPMERLWQGMGIAHGTHLCPV